MRCNPFYDRSELDIAGTYLFKEIIEFKGIVGVEVVHYRHRVPFHPMFFQQVDALHHFYKGRFAKFVLAVFIVELLWTVDGYTHQPVVLFKEFAPFVGE